MVFFIRTMIKCEVMNVRVEQLSLVEYVRKGMLLMLLVFVKFERQKFTIFMQLLSSSMPSCKMEMWR